MATRKPYLLADGSRVPGVTTILSKFKDPGGLIHWAWTEGSEGRDYRESRDDAGSAGTQAHNMIEAYIHGDEYKVPADLDPDIEAKAHHCFEQFKRWISEKHITLVAAEARLVSEKYKFGGMIDAIGIVGDDGELCLVDWKTSNRLYPEYLCQISAYKELWNENVGKGTLPESLDRPLTGPFLLCRFDKEFADFAEQQYVELGSAWERFVHLRECYEIDKELKRRC